MQYLNVLWKLLKSKLLLGQFRFLWNNFDLVLEIRISIGRCLIFRFRGAALPFHETS